MACGGCGAPHDNDPFVSFDHYPTVAEVQAARRQAFWNEYPASTP